MEADDDASVIGAATVVPENTDGVPVGPVSDSTWVVVQVSGQFRALANPECAVQPPNWPCIFNAPASNFYEPAPSMSGPVQAWVLSTRTRQVPLRGIGGAANTAGQAVGLYFGEAPGSLMVRSAMQNFGTQNPNPVGQVSSWKFSGEYNATARRIPNPLTFSGGPTGDAGGAVTFTVGTTAPLLFINPVGVPASAPPGSVDWYFVPGDSVPLNYERSSQAWQVFSCWLRTTCTFTPPANLNGRMQVVAYVEGRLVIGRSAYVRGGQEPKLVLKCNDMKDSLRLVRGAAISCAPGTEPAGASITISKWEFAGTGGYTYPGPDDFPVTDPEWSGPMVMSGTIKVTAKVASSTVDRTASLNVTITPRTAAPPQPDLFSVRVGTLQEFEPASQRPRVPPRNEHDLGKISFGPVMFGNDDPVLAASFLGFVTDGPNTHLAYLTKVPARVNAIVVVNPEMRVGSDFYRRHPQAREAVTATCVQERWQRYTDLILHHEGYPVNDQSHAGYYRKILDEKAWPAVEDVVRPDNDLASMVREWQGRLAPVFAEAAAYQYRVDREHPVPFNCTFKF